MAIRKSDDDVVPSEARFQVVFLFQEPDSYFFRQCHYFADRHVVLYTSKCY